MADAVSEKWGLGDGSGSDLLDNVSKRLSELVKEGVLSKVDDGHRHYTYFVPERVKLTRAENQQPRVGAAMPKRGGVTASEYFSRDYRDNGREKGPLSGILTYGCPPSSTKNAGSDKMRLPGASR